MPKNTNKVVWRAVKPFANLAYIYGFKGRVDSADALALGQAPITAQTAVLNLVLEANTFRPHEMRKKTAAGSKGSYVHAAKIASAKQAGYEITKKGFEPKKKKSTTLSKVLYITINSVKYGWRLTDGSSTTIDFAKLGITEATGTEADIVYGCTFPRPPRVRIVANGKTTETFCAPDKLETAAAAGWMKSDDGLYTAEHLAALVG